MEKTRVYGLPLFPIQITRFGKIKLGSRRYELLYYFVEKPGESAYDIGGMRKNEKTKKDYYYKDVKNRIKRLKDLKLIEEVKKYPFGLQSI
ncbi:MAG: hypothetical protein WAK17_10275 [Candidatus Nitrosopolaris sp.]|jgi:hypothetical protein